MTLRFDTVIQQLLHQVPEYRHIYDAEIAQWGDDELEYFLFGVALIQFIQKVHSDKLAGSTTAHLLLQRLFGFIEQCAIADDKAVVELIQMGFLEELLKQEVNMNPFLPYMGQATQQLNQEIRQWWQKLVPQDETPMPK